MRRPAIVLALFSIALIAPTYSAAQSSCEDGSAHAYLTLTTTQTEWDGCTVVFEPTLTTLTVVATPHVPMTKVRFSVQPPPFGVIIDATWNYDYVGIPEAGIEITLPECTTGPSTVLGQMIVLTLDLPALDGNCVPWKIDDGPEIEDCDGAVRPASARYHEASTAPGCCYYIDCASIPPYDLYPPDGATGVPVDVVLSWAWGYGYVSVEIGTDPACYSGQEFYLQDAHSFAPDFLEHETTYYWQVGWSDGLECGGTSPRFSFTTAGPVAAETSTWGQIKALYR